MACIPKVDQATVMNCFFNDHVLVPFPDKIHLDFQKNGSSADDHGANKNYSNCITPPPQIGEETSL